MSTETEILDRLFLELSQFTTAKTKRELELESLNAELLAVLKGLHDWTVNNLPLSKFEGGSPSVLLKSLDAIAKAEAKP